MNLRLRHQFPAASCRATVSGPRTFFLRNQLGDWLAMASERQSRYDGWFLQDGERFVKIVERIALIGQEISGIATEDPVAAWEYENGNSLVWQLHPTLSALNLSASQEAVLEITLDIRPMYEHPEMGREYKVTSSEGQVLIEYHDPVLSTPYFLAVQSKGEIQLKQEWVPVDYPRDRQRHSPPDHLYAFILGTCTGKQLSLGVGSTAAEAVAAAGAASRLPSQPPGVGVSHSHDTLVNELAVAKACADRALKHLQTEAGLYAGLPWFHQVWSRDELIAALGLPPDLQRDVIQRYLGLPLETGELPTFAGSGTTCADGVGWLSLLVREHGLENLSEEDRERLLHFLTAAREGLKEDRQVSHGLIHSEHNATWMDTIGRSGFRLEIQCMFALVLELLHILTEDSKYERERISMLGKIRSHFWHAGCLADGLADFSIRPNVFLAYLIQPDLLTASSWEECFDTALGKLRLSWGGLASLDREDPDFLEESTGQDNRSYHCGDSWFFINNLAAIALYRLNRQHFGSDIMGILQSSTQEILWENMIGQPGEISSAGMLDSFGCGVQAFSAGTYLALLSETEREQTGGQEVGETFWETASGAPLPVG